MIRIKTNSAHETVAFGESIGKKLIAGDVVLLCGDLGAGKTAFTGGIAKGLGIVEHIISPTFTIVNQYDAEIKLYHFDVYRIADSDEMLAMGFEDYFDGSAVVVIEWAELITEILPPEHIKIEIKMADGDNPDERDIVVDYHGDRYRDRV